MTRPYIIAEAGVDHEGSTRRLRKLITAAVDARADAFKTQYYKKGLRGPNRELPWLTETQVIEAAAYCRQRGITFLCTPHDVWSLEFLEKHNLCPAYKIGSGMVRRPAFIELAQNTKRPLFVSTGMHTERDVVLLAGRLDPSRDFILHCNSTYPTPAKMARIRYIFNMAEFWSGGVGYSDHCAGSGAVIAACTLGVQMVEKHICLRENVRGRQDTQCALSPKRFKQLVLDIEEAVEATRESPMERIPTPGELVTLGWVRAREQQNLTSPA
tara:strand:+ start:5704 stop:6513 length:810 start_codon:yes stop_codon:yes gene_type:complete